MNSFHSAFHEIFTRLPGRRRGQFWLLIGYELFVAAAGTLSAGVIALFAAAFSAPDEMLKSKYIVLVQDFFKLEMLESAKGVMILLSALVVILLVIKNIAECILNYVVARFGAAIEAHFGGLLFNGFLHMPYEWHVRRNSADLILALQWRCFVGHSFINTALKILNDGILVLFLMMAVFLANPLIAFLVVILTGTIGYLIYDRIHRLQEKEAEKYRVYEMSINRQVTRGIHGIKDIKVSGKTSFFTNFMKDVYAFARIQGMRNFYAGLPVGLLETVGFTLLSGIIVFMLYFTKSSSLEVTATISLLIVAAWKILPAINRIMGGFISIRNILPYIRSQMEYVHAIESQAVFAPASQGGASQEISFENKIEVRDVYFAYEGKKDLVLEDINLTIEKGQTFGIVGRSGVGKSTLVDILIGLLKPTRGKVLIDGVELSAQNCNTWMKKLSYVPQSPYIFDGSIAENVAFGIDVLQIDRAWVLQCCQMAFMQDILEMLPHGIDTLIGERGVRLSGGQRQRVVIARALYSRPELIIFDEATSSLDSKSEKAVQDTIDALKGRKTLVVIAHRLKTVESCDCLIWLEEGKAKMVGKTEGILQNYEASLF